MKNTYEMMIELATDASKKDAFFADSMTSETELKRHAEHSHKLAIVTPKADAHKLAIFTPEANGHKLAILTPEANGHKLAIITPSL